jgi:hypothetical protein
MVRFLLENGANPTIKDKTGRDALAIAQHLKRDEVVKILQQKLKPAIEEQVKVLKEELKEIIKDIQVRHVHERDLMEINRKMEMKNEKLELPIRLLNEENFKNNCNLFEKQENFKEAFALNVDVSITRYLSLLESFLLSPQQDLNAFSSHLKDLRGVDSDQSWIYVKANCQLIAKAIQEKIFQDSFVKFIEVKAADARESLKVFKPHENEKGVENAKVCLKEIDELEHYKIGIIPIQDLNDSLMEPKFHREYGFQPSDQEKGVVYWKGALGDDGKGSRGEIPYFCPSGWKRYALKTTKDEDEFTKKYGDWCIMYHGTAQRFASNILQTGFKTSMPSGWNRCYLKNGERGVYFSNSIIYCGHPRYAKITKNTKEGKPKFIQMVFQCRVNPELVKKGIVGPETLLKDKKRGIDPNVPNEKMEYVIKGEGDYITMENGVVCTGIMIRVLDHNPKELKELEWAKEQGCYESFEMFDELAK